MPLLLAWIQSPNASLQTEAARTLAAVVQNTWPRMSTHAPSLWRQLDAAYTNEAAAARVRPSVPGCLASEQAESFRHAGRLLYWCGSDALRTDVMAGRSDSAFAQAVLAGV